MDRHSEKERLVNDFVVHLLEQQRIRSIGGDYVVANRHADAYSNAQLELFQKYGDEGREAFSCLLEHPEPAVRGFAAAVLLRYKHNKAMQVLKDLAQRHDLGLICAGAQATIGRWEDGNWDLDPAENDE